MMHITSTPANFNTKNVLKLFLINAIAHLSSESN